MSEPSAANALRVLAAAVDTHRQAEDRPSQREMAELVATALESGEPLIVQAGTGTGKSLAYLAAAVGSQARVVVSTATRQLSDQLLSTDVPLIAAASGTLGISVSSAVLKGRANYLCLAKLDELHRLDAQAEAQFTDAQLDLGIAEPEPEPESPRKPTSADLVALNELVEWATDDPGSGDRSEAPAVPDRVWQQLSTPAAACPSARKCAFGDDCFAELARETARASDIVVTNHALLAADMISPSPLFADRDAFIIDEVHELSDYLSSAWGAEVHAGTLERVALGVNRSLGNDGPEGAELGKRVVVDVAAVISGLTEVPEQRWPEAMPSYLAGPLESLGTNLKSSAKLLDKKLKDLAASPGDASRLQILRSQLVDSIEAIEMVRVARSDVVRWSARERESDTSVLRAAPLEVGPKFAQLRGERAIVATSATAAVAGDFSIVADTLGVTEETWRGVDVGSPFDFAKQAILYIPPDIPAPIGKERVDHTAAVLDVLVELVEAAGGRTLGLFTTTAAARNAAAHLRKHTQFTILEHGELAAADLAEEFAQDETSVLCATMGMWSGLNVVGPACSLVVIDKLPFAPMDDPLRSARRANIDAGGGDGFTEVFVAETALKLTQGAGRLIRSKQDRGVVAILDPRLLTKRYGKAMLASLPPMWRTTDKEVAVASLRRLRQGG